MISNPASESCLKNEPAQIIISTVGNQRSDQCQEVVKPYCKESKPPSVKLPSAGPSSGGPPSAVPSSLERKFHGVTLNGRTQIFVILAEKENKRHQLKKAFEDIAKQKKEKPEITVLFDGHVIWPENYLKWALAPFEEKKNNERNEGNAGNAGNTGNIGNEGNEGDINEKEEVVTVATNKRVLHDRVGSTPTGDGWHNFSWASYWNFLGAVYLKRHNFELKVTNYIDGSVFTISGRTALYKTHALVDPNLCKGLINEFVWFGKYGPLNADDDDFLTRWIVREGCKEVEEEERNKKRNWQIKFQAHEEACITTTVGEYPKFLQQCTRWVHTTCRSSSASLFADRGPVGILLVLLSSFRLSRED